MTCALQPGCGDAAGRRQRNEHADCFGVGQCRRREIDVKVVGASYVYTREQSLWLTVTPAGGGPQTAVYDATLRAPKCAAVGSSCDSGPSLLAGR